MFRAFKIHNLTPADLKAGLDKGEVLLIDVREADEYAGERIEGAVNLPLSQMAPERFPDPNGRKVVMQCQGGVRSKKAAELCTRKGLKVEHHLDGGLNGWKAHGLPTLRS